LLETRALLGEITVVNGTYFIWIDTRQGRFSKLNTYIKCPCEKAIFLIFHAKPGFKKGLYVLFLIRRNLLFFVSADQYSW